MPYGSLGLVKINSLFSLPQGSLGLYIINSHSVSPYGSMYLLAASSQPKVYSTIGTSFTQTITQSKPFLNYNAMDCKRAPVYLSHTSNCGKQSMRSIDQISFQARHVRKAVSNHFAKISQSLQSISFFGVKSSKLSTTAGVAHNYIVSKVTFTTGPRPSINICASSGIVTIAPKQTKVSIVQRHVPVKIIETPIAVKCFKYKIQLHSKIMIREVYGCSKISISITKETIAKHPMIHVLTEQYDFLFVLFSD